MPDRHGGTGNVWADLERDVVLAVGGDAREFLHSQFAQDIAALSVGESCHSLLLQPTGHIAAVTRVARRADDVFTIDVDAGFATAVVERLAKFVLRARVRLEPVDWLCRMYRGPGVAASVAAGAEPHTVVVPWWGARVDAADAVGPRHELPSGESIGASPIDGAARERLRADECWPRLGVDLSPGDVAASSGIVPATVSFTKGCYPGQELVERMDSRGAAAPWQLRCIPAAEATGLDSGVAVTSVGDVWALAHVRRGDPHGVALSEVAPRGGTAGVSVRPAPPTSP